MLLLSEEKVSSSVLDRNREAWSKHVWNKTIWFEVASMEVWPRSHFRFPSHMLIVVTLCDVSDIPWMMDA
jgi:hypothetical protein